MLRILAASPYYDPEGGGLERYAREILSRLRRRGHDVQAAAFTDFAPGENVVAGVPVRRFARRWRLGRASFDPRFGRWIGSFAREWRPDVVVGHAPVPGAAEHAFFSTRRLGAPFVATYHSGRLRASSPLLHALAGVHRVTWERRMLDGSARLVAVAPYVRDHALARQRARTVVIPPGVDPVRFSPGPAPPDDGLLFVAPTSRAYRWKGLDVLWDAFERVRRRAPRATLTVVGDGDRRMEFVKKARAASVPARFVGRVSGRALADYYRQAAVVVVPSRTDAEAFGMVSLEAHACARPVVASRVGGIPGVVEDGRSGLLVEPGDAGSLAESILRLLRDPDLAARLGQEGRRRALAGHNWDDLAARTERVLRDAVAAA